MFSERVVQRCEDDSGGGIGAIVAVAAHIENTQADEMKNIWKELYGAFFRRMFFFFCCLFPNAMVFF